MANMITLRHSLYLVLVLALMLAGMPVHGQMMITGGTDTSGMESPSGQPEGAPDSQSGDPCPHDAHSSGDTSGQAADSDSSPKEMAGDDPCPFSGADCCGPDCLSACAGGTGAALVATPASMTSTQQKLEPTTISDPASLPPNGLIKPPKS